MSTRGEIKRRTAVEKLVLFDLDGTLIDAAADIAAAAKPLLVARGLAPLTLEEAKALLGDGLRVFLARAFALRGSTVTEDETAEFIRGYTRAPIEKTCLYPGVEETLSTLSSRGWTMAVCTNKVELAAVDILQQLKILRYFEAVCGGDAVIACKPDPRHLREAILRVGGEGAQAVMVGDNRVDIVAAQACGIPSIFVAWGYGGPEVPSGASKAAYKVGDLPDLLSTTLME